MAELRPKNVCPNMGMRAIFGHWPNMNFLSFLSKTLNILQNSNYNFIGNVQTSHYTNSRTGQTDGQKHEHSEIINIDNCPTMSD